MTMCRTAKAFALLGALLAGQGCAHRVQPGLIPLVSTDGRVVDVPGRLLSCPEALYPMNMQTTGFNVTVTFEFVIDTAGRADSASIRLVATDHPAFVNAARAALRRCRFAPALSGGQPVATRNRFAFTFTVL